MQQHPSSLALAAPVWDRIERFANLLAERNSAHNLVSRQDVHRLWPRHILDSLGALPHLAGANVLDIGSGGGLPGMVLAIADPQRLFTLAERSEKKARFLEFAVDTLGLANVRIARDVAKLEQRFDTVTARAVAPPDKLWPLALSRLTETGRAVFFVSAHLDDWRPAGCSVRRESGLEELGAPRELLIIERAGSDHESEGD